MNMNPWFTIDRIDKDTHIITLMRYAAQFRVEKVLRRYLEVLL